MRALYPLGAYSWLSQIAFLLFSFSCWEQSVYFQFRKKEYVLLGNKFSFSIFPLKYSLKFVWIFFLIIVHFNEKFEGVVISNSMNLCNKKRELFLHVFKERRRWGQESRFIKHKIPKLKNHWTAWSSFSNAIQSGSTSIISWSMDFTQTYYSSVLLCLSEMYFLMVFWLYFIYWIIYPALVKVLGRQGDSCLK